jgi:hypothetical protein
MFTLAVAVFCGISILLNIGGIRVAPAIGHAIARAARLVWRVIGPALHTVVGAIKTFVLLLVRPIGAAISFVAVPFGRAIVLAARAIGRAVAVVAVHVARAVAFAAVGVAQAITLVAVPIGHAIGFAVRAIVGVIGAAARTIGHGAAIAARRAGRAGRVVLVVITPIARAIVAMGSAIRRMLLSPAARAIEAFATAVAPVVKRAGHRLLAIASLTAGWVRTRVLRLRHSVGVAAARARQTSAVSAALHAAAEPPRVAAPPPPFSAQVFHNEFLPSGGRTVDAVITVTAHVDANGHGSTPTAEVILVDCSGSMGQPWRKIRAARRATVAAIDALPDGARFAVVRANHDADVVYPAHHGLAVKDDETAADARRAVQMLWPEGGTAMGRWLLVARDLLATAPHAIGHAILLTDGKNESETAEALATAQRACRGRFQCDCRGVGTDWDVAELRGIAHELLGTVDIVADPADLAADFRAMAEQAAGKRVDGVRLRVWTPADSVVRFIKQVSPSIEDLGVRPARVDARTVDYPTGAWSDESRDYHLSIELPAKPTGTEMLAARVSLIAGERVLSKALVTATWTEDLELSTRIVPEVVHYTGQSELLGAVQEGLDRRRAGDEAGALAHFGEATRRAYETGNEATLQLLAQVVEIEDAPTGRVRVRAVVEDADLMALDTRSTRTTRFAAPQPVASVSSD